MDILNIPIDIIKRYKASKAEKELLALLLASSVCIQILYLPM